MDPLTQLRRLLDHLEWANRRVVEAVDPSSGDHALRLVEHLLAAERVWLTRLETGDSSGLEIWPDPEPGAWVRGLSENVAAYQALMESLEEADLDREVSYRNSRGVEFHTPVAEILLHVFLHGAYHRGQIALRLRDGGDEPVNTDFITFVRQHPLEQGPS